METSTINGVIVESRGVLLFVFCPILAKHNDEKFIKIDISGLENG